jgi:metal-responsive CopG/Arc/MetJ family transcriptional regulator
MKTEGLDTINGMTYGNTERPVMPKAKIAISIADHLLRRLDRLVQNKTFLNRSQAIETALAEKLDRLDKIRLARECGKLDPAYEKEIAEEGFSEELSRWPEY